MIKKLILSLISFYKLFGRKASVLTILTEIMARVPGWVQSAISFAGYSTREKFDEFLNGFDDYTGSDPGAVDIIRDLPAEKEEILMDHIKEAARILGYNQLKIPGYFVDDTAE